MGLEVVFAAGAAKESNNFLAVFSHKHRMPLLARSYQAQYVASVRFEQKSHCLEGDCMPESIASAEQSSRTGKESLRDFIGFVFLEAIASPMAADAWQAVKADQVRKAVALYGLAALPCIAGLVVLGGTWSLTRSKIGNWLASWIYPVASNAFSWLALFIVIFVYLATPILLIQLKSGLTGSEMPIRISNGSRLPLWQDTPLNNRGGPMGPLYAISLLELFARAAPCTIRVTAGSDNENLRAEFLWIAQPWHSCDLYQEPSLKVPLIDQPTPTPPSAGLIIRYNEKFTSADQIAEYLYESDLNARISHHGLPKNGPLNLIWIDIGPGSPWK